MTLKRLILVSLACIALLAYPTMTHASQRIDSVIHDQLAAIEKQGFTLPPMTVTVVKPFGWNGIAVIAERPTKYTVLIVEWAFWNPKEIARVVRHEIGHVLLDVHGVENSEANADRFAACATDETKDSTCDEFIDKLR